MMSLNIREKGNKATGFSDRLLLLRKERKLSQKQAAADLGVSQSLLSHYEKGIRECGNDFLVKAAEYYGVSCDYLLGRTARTGSLPSLEELKELAADNEYCVETALRAFCILLDRISTVDVEYSKRLETFMALNIYRIVVAGAQAGYIPKNWFDRCFEEDGNLFFRLSLSSLTDSFLAGARTSEPMGDERIPKSIETVEKRCKEYLDAYLKQVSSL